ncbi:hypothetical protein WH47_00768 [Habropoda laboriosa]|uniref:Uncharacterized protein n=2 Tax=Habropoda laboriosa TaxID=597456 RepID=A0A0L7QYK9_9HYME|nr:hypothetical protein WH47_00768 [Habropoda laboriosa]
MDDMAPTSSSSHVMLSSAHSLDTFKMSQLPRQVTTCNNNDNSHNTSCGNIIMVESSLNAKPACSSVIVPLSSHSTGTILPLSNKLKVTHKSTKTMPKITVNTSNLQRIHKPQTVQKNSLVDEIDDELGNILDIPIIFAKDDDNLNSIEKNPSLSQAIPIDVREKSTPKLSSNTKVVLISNKQDKLQQTTNKFVTPTQTIICPNVAVQNLNHVILQTKSQNPTLSKTKATIPIQTRSNQPTVKYTKIILAKRNSQLAHQNDKNEQVIVTKTIDKINTPKLLNFDKNEHRYAQIAPKQSTRNENNILDEALEIEDAIKMNIIERKHIPVQRVDLPSQTIDNVKEILTETNLNVIEESNSECTKIDDVINLQI